MNAGKTLSALDLAAEGLARFMKLRHLYTPEDIDAVMTLLRTSDPELLNWVKQVVS